jgi:gluconate 2-dehydrogenase subunit 3-like protein
MSDISRRDALRRLGLALMATGALDRVAAHEVHHMAAEAQAAASGPYTPKSFSATEFRTLERLTDLIIPVENGAPGALAAGCAAWIDMISSENDQLKKIYKNGFAWVDGAMKTRGAASFVEATPAQQTALLDQIAYRRNQSPELNPGIEFFTWARRMTVDAFYTSEIGIKDIDYRGNRPMGAYPEPTEQIAYVLKRVPTL